MDDLGKKKESQQQQQKVLTVKFANSQSRKDGGDTRVGPRNKDASGFRPSLTNYFKTER